jgi:hypothetical protein
MLTHITCLPCPPHSFACIITGFLHGNEVAALNSTVLLDSAKFALRFALGIKPNSKEDSKVGEEQALFQLKRGNA